MTLVQVEMNLAVTVWMRMVVRTCVAVSWPPLAGAAAKQAS